MANTDVPTDIVRDVICPFQFAELVELIQSDRLKEAAILFEQTIETNRDQAVESDRSNRSESAIWADRD